MSYTSFLDEVLEGIQPDVIVSLQRKLTRPFINNIQFDTRQCALTLLGDTAHAIVCVKNPEMTAEYYLCVPYQKNPDDSFEIGNIMKVSPEQVIRLKQGGIIPNT